MGVVSRLGDDVGGSSRHGNAPGGDQLLSDPLDDGDSTVGSECSFVSIHIGSPAGSWCG